MGSVGDESPEAVLKEVAYECPDVKAEVPLDDSVAVASHDLKVEVLEPEAYHDDVAVVKECHDTKAEVSKVEVLEPEAYHDDVAVVKECHDTKAEVSKVEVLEPEAHHDDVAVVKECHDTKAEVSKVEVLEPEAHHDDVAVVKECHDTKAEVSKVEVLEPEAHHDDVAVVKECHDTKAEVSKVEVLEVEVHGDVAVVKACHDTKAEADVPEADVHPDAAVLKECQELRAEAEVFEAEVHKENVADWSAQEASAVMGAGIDDRDKVDSVSSDSAENTASDAAAAVKEKEVVPMATGRRRLPEVKRFSARRSVGVEDPNAKQQTDVVFESKSPAAIRKQRGALKFAGRMKTGIDDRDTVDYGSIHSPTKDPKRVETPKPVQKVDENENGTDVVVEEVVSMSKPKQLSVAERVQLRLSGIKRNKDIVCLERIRGKLVNITEGLELHTGVFSRVEQERLVDMVRDLQTKGREKKLKERTYSEPRKWMRGKGRVTMQFGCCYNYAVDKQGNPPGILREDVVDPLPPLLRTTIKRLVSWHVLPPSCVPDSCIINMYEEGDCIPPHIDHHDFLRPFSTLSLLSECKIVFGANLEILGPGDFGGNLSLPLPVGSVLVLNGNGADVAKHAVPAVPTERISITFRKMDPSKVPRGFKIDEELQNLQPVRLHSQQPQALQF